jgi:hypothetical protein
MNRRTFVGWLGGVVGAVGLYKEFPDTYRRASINETALAVASPDAFIIKNESTRELFVTQQYTDAQIASRSAARQAMYRNIDRTLKIKLMPGEELAISVQR